MVSNKSRKGTLFPAITAASRELRVSRITLYRVLKDQLPDRQNLRTRYREYQTKHKVSPPKGIGGET